MRTSAFPLTLAYVENASMKDRVLLLVTGIICAGLAALSFRLTGEYTAHVNIALGALAWLAYFKRRSRDKKCDRRQ